MERFWSVDTNTVDNIAGLLSGLAFAWLFLRRPALVIRACQRLGIKLNERWALIIGYLCLAAAAVDLLTAMGIYIR